ncbi:MAG: peptide chain release factor N(5)-glutamine methyltransferase [Novosphingobium sp.]
MTIAQALRAASESLSVTSDTPRLDAELLMAHAMRKSRSELLLRHMADTPPAAFASFVERRLAHEPVAYIVGRQEFYGIEFAVNRHTLIPRADSETLVEAALSACPDAENVLDCGTGSGALLAAVLVHLPQAQGVGIDRSGKALDVADANIGGLGLAHRARLIEADWTRGDWQKVFRGGRFDLILANPPYVEDTAELMPSVAVHEPHSALFAGPEGLDDYRALIPQLPGLLAPAGVAIVEIGHAQADAVTAIAQAAGLTARLHRDLGARPRALELRQSA